MSGASVDDLYARMRKRLAPAGRKRFFSSVEVEERAGGFAILLDGRGIKTPAGEALIVPSGPLAKLVAAEWDAQDDQIKPASMPVMRMVSTALDLVRPSPGAAVKEILGYALTDLLLLRAETPEGLVRLQEKRQAPLLEAAGGLLGVSFRVSHGLTPAEQSPDALEALEERVWGCGPFTLAGLHALTTLSASVLMAVCVQDGTVEPETAWAAAHVEEDWNIARWGEDGEAAARRQDRWREFAAAARFCASVERGQ